MVSRTLRMLRFRGKRFWLFAAVVTILIFWWSQKVEPLPEYDFSIPAKKVEDALNKHVKEFEKALPPAHEVKKTTSLPVVEDTPSPSPARYTSPSPTAAKDEEEEDEDEEQEDVALETTVEQTPKTSSAPARTPTPTLAPVPTVPDRVLPDRQKPQGFPPNGQYVRPADQEGRKQYPVVSSTTTIHWRSQTEHYPVPTESMIHFPTGPAGPIPKIQFKFDDETPTARINREKRQLQVKTEFQKAWKGYREHAWLHDELSPVSGGFRDPFCGWAATLVDGLDTLCIMGLDKEFEEAVKAVGNLDFTTSPRYDIPIFETTIRYLGGLLAAYDVSGQKHKILLDKAVELGNILMGAFDTPNRMPVLFYQWTPEVASQPHYASNYANTAELGSLSLEFTRLAQLTKEPRYYDAVARISNALSEYQDRGTGLDGVFPENIDASGCNRTVASIPMAFQGGRGGSEQVMGDHLEAERDLGKSKATPAPGASSPGMVNAPSSPPQPKPTTIPESQIEKRAPIQKKPFLNTTAPSLTSNGKKYEHKNLRQVDISTNSILKTPSSVVDDDTCKPQGLVSSNPTGNNKYGMGGGQDSTYEYFPKQYLLLGGRDQMYGKMYLKTIQAIRKDMLFRPMIPGDRDILFSGSLSKSLGKDLPENPLPPMVMTPEVEHLTCFIGGMIGMGAKIFEQEGDLDLAIKLTDGCVWAYEAFASGIMPEASQVVPCEDVNDCTWDEETWHLALDPLGKEAREEHIAVYIENKAKMEVERKEALKTAEATAAKELADTEAQDTLIAESELRKKVSHAGSTSADRPLAGEKLESFVDSLGSDTLKVEQPPVYDTLKTKPTPLDENRFLKDDIPVPLQKRGLNEPQATEIEPGVKAAQDDSDLTPLPKKSEPRPNTDLKVAPGAASPLSNATSDSSLRKASSKKATKPNNILPSEGDPNTPMRDNTGAIKPKSEFPLFDPNTPANETAEIDYLMPLTHKQVVDAQIEQGALPPGFTSIRSRKYILRPEAIESVWYMYRITGDPIWQDKGWKMFEAIIAATSAEFGHSAIQDVAADPPVQADEMESFWLAETLKYFYLLFSTPDTISLDEWVLNTEAHPFKRPESNV